MDPTKLLQDIQAAGPSAGIGFAAGLSFLVMGFRLKWWVMIERFNDMSAQRDDIQKRLDKQEAEHKLETAELKTELRATSVALDETRLMFAASVGTSRKNAHLASSLMTKSHALPVAEDDHG